MKKYVLTIVLTLSIAFAHINSASAAIVIDTGALGAKVNEVIGFIKEITDEVNKAISTIEKIKTEGINKLALLEDYKKGIFNFNKKSSSGSDNIMKGTKEKEGQYLEAEKVVTIEANKSLNSAQQGIAKSNLDELTKKEEETERKRKAMLDRSIEAYNIAVENMDNKEKILEKELEIFEQTKAYKDLLEEVKALENKIQDAEKKRNEAKNKEEKENAENELNNIERSKESIEKNAIALKKYIDDLSQTIDKDKAIFESDRKALYESIVNNPEYVAIQLELEAINRQKEIQEIVLDKLEEEGEIIGTADDPTVIQFEKRQEALNNSEDAVAAPTIVEGNQDGDAGGSEDISSKYQIKDEDYQNFVKTYFFDEKEIQEQVKNMDGDDASKEIQNKQDTVKRQRKLLLASTMSHLMQVTASIRREVPVNTKKAKEVYDNAVSADDLITTIGYHSELRIEQTRALLLYARVQAAKLQYLSAKEIHGAKLEKKGHKKGGPVKLEDYKVDNDSVTNMRKELEARAIDLHKGL